MVTEQVLEGGLLINSMRNFRCSISARNASIFSLIEEDERVLSKFPKSKVV